MMTPCGSKSKWSFEKLILVPWAASILEFKYLLSMFAHAIVSGYLLGVVLEEFSSHILL